MAAKRRCSDLTIAQWNQIKCKLPQKGKVGRPFINLRNTVNGIIYIMKTGISWRDVPVRYGNWNNIYRTFKIWQKNGTLEKIRKFLNDESTNTSTNL